MIELLIEKSIKELNSKKSYVEFLKQFPVLKNPDVEIGQLYSCDNYDFDDKNPQAAYFDKMPLQLVFNKTETHYWAISLHFIPVLMRASFLKKVQNLNPVQFKKNSKFKDIKIKISYNTLKSLFSKVPAACRCYRYDRVNNLRKIPLEKWIEASQYQPNTFNSVGIEDIVKRFKNNK